MRGVKCLKLSVFIAGIEKKGFVVIPFQAVTHHELGLGIDDGIVPTLILQNYGFYLLSVIGYMEIAIVELHR